MSSCKNLSCPQCQNYYKEFNFVRIFVFGLLLDLSVVQSNIKRLFYVCLSHSAGVGLIQMADGEDELDSFFIFSEMQNLLADVPM